MNFSLLATALGLLLLFGSFVDSLAFASPAVNLPLCAAGDRYFTVKNPAGFEIGTCCAPNLAGAVWKNGKPACSLGIRFATPARNVANCPWPAVKGKAGDLQVCNYFVSKRSVCVCPNDASYHIVKSPAGTPYGVCCSSNLAGAVWDGDKPACSLGVKETTRALNVLSCPPQSKIWWLKGLDTCKYVPLNSKRDQDHHATCVDDTVFRTTFTNGSVVGYCCPVQLDKASTKDSTLKCCNKRKCINAGDDLHNCPSGFQKSTFQDNAVCSLVPT